jgi:two-component system, OmpR family, sensor histidine kinase ChvG
MQNLRFGIRLKLLLLSLFLFAIPWLGYKYVWELESYLRIGQEQTMVGTARAVATALHERPALFDNQAAYLSDVRPGTDLYAHKISDPIRLDGDLSDWQDYRHLAVQYGEQNLISQEQDYQFSSLHFEHMVGQYNKFLYAMFAVVDDQLILRPSNSLRVDRNDHLLIALTDQDGLFRRYIVAPRAEGWVNAYLLEDNFNSLRPVKPETRIQGQWRITEQGYNIELRFPLQMMSSKIAFAIADVDDANSMSAKYVIGTANPAQSDSLGTVLVPSPEIENILKGLKYSNARVWVVDKHMRVLARSGYIQRSSGVESSQNKDSSAWWHYIEEEWLFPLYYHILTKPPADFVDELKDAYALKGQDISQALAGKPDSLWRISPDNKAVILSAAHPIFINDRVMGAVVVEQTTNGIRTLRNKALEQLFHIILAVMGLGTLALFLFASRISFRIRKLRDETEGAIDKQGKIIKSIRESATRDEIGDLSRTFANVLDKLSQYNHYLENMASRLSHELRTPVAIVNSSLENMMLGEQNEENTQYIERAQKGIKRLSKILSNMSEATRLEQAIQGSDKEEFNLQDMLTGCVEGYQQAYPQRKFSVQCDQTAKTLLGSPELFAQMLDKIVANALEFSETGAGISFVHEYKQGKHKLSIRNGGQSLPENMQDKLFDSMVSVRSGEVSELPHLGLGLYVARIIAEYHGAVISIRDLEDNSGVEVSLVFT